MELYPTYTGSNKLNCFKVIRTETNDLELGQTTIVAPLLLREGNPRFQGHSRFLGTRLREQRREGMSTKSPTRTIRNDT